MIDKICNFLTNRIRKEMPDIDDERAEVINYGLQNIVGEIPKIFIMLTRNCSIRMSMLVSVRSIKFRYLIRT